MKYTLKQNIQRSLLRRISILNLIIEDRFIFYKEDTPTLLIERTSTKIEPLFDIKSIDGVALYNAVHGQVLHGNEFNYSFEDKNISIKYKDDPRKLKVYVNGAEKYQCYALKGFKLAILNHGNQVALIKRQKKLMIVKDEYDIETESFMNPNTLLAITLFWDQNLKDDYMTDGLGASIGGDLINKNKELLNWQPKS